MVRIRQTVLTTKREGGKTQTYEITKKIGCTRNYATIVRNKLIENRTITEEDWPNHHVDVILKVKNFHRRMDEFCERALKVLTQLKGKSRREIDSAVAE